MTYGSKVKILMVPQIDSMSVNEVLVAYENDEIFQKYYEVLSKEQANIYEISGREFEAKINIKSDNEYVLFTIPYDKGFKILVNGKEAEAIKVQDTLMAIKVRRRRTYNKYEIFTKADLE